MGRRRIKRRYHAGPRGGRYRLVKMTTPPHDMIRVYKSTEDYQRRIRKKKGR